LNEYANEFLYLLLYAGIVVFLAAVIIVLSYVLGERHSGNLTGEPYESGIAPSESARIRFSSRFYIVAMFFVIFDLEAVFLAAWAIAFKEAGWSGYIGILIFIILLFTVLIYEWRIGALNFAGNGRKIINILSRSGK
jgi:NADH-quinone oxidoreductase subunit A